MPIDFQITALPVEPFQPLFQMTDAELAERGAKRCIADASPGYPCRVSLEDAAPGETLILLPFAHQATDSPYRASGPIFVRVGARQARLGVNEVPEAVRRRLLSVRAYDACEFMVDAEVTEGAALEEVIEQFFADNQVAFLHLHNARPGCYACRVDRAGNPAFPVEQPS